MRRMIILVALALVWHFDASSCIASPPSCGLDVLIGLCTLAGEPAGDVPAGGSITARHQVMGRHARNQRGRCRGFP